MLGKLVAKKEYLSSKFINWMFPTETQEDAEYVSLMFNRLTTSLLIIMLYGAVLTATVLILKVFGV